MNNTLYSLILTGLAGMSTLVGYFFIYLKGDQERIIKSALSFASGVMIMICFIDLIPNAFNYLNNYNVLYQLLIILFFVLTGITIINFFDKLLVFDIKDANLYKLGFLTMLGIIFHNIPEGIVTFMVSGINKKIGLSLGIAIGIHNIPEGIGISIPIYYATNNKLKTFFYTFIAGISELLGGILCFLFLKEIFNNIVLGITFSLIAGIMLKIGFNLYQEGKKLYILIVGFIIMLLGHLLI